MQKALNHLRKIRPERTYVVSLQTMVFARAEPEKDRLLIGRNVKWLESTQIAEGPYKGAWTYPGIGGEGDNSNSQFALLALHEAEQHRRRGQRPDLAIWPRSIGNTVRTPTAPGATTSRRPSAPEA